METILYNLIENGIQYRRKTKAEIYVRIFEFEDQVILEYTDYGEGIPDDIKKNIFQMYFRGSENSKGNGLGLYVVSRAAEKLKGNIDVVSKTGEFTKFIISFYIHEHHPQA